MKADGILMHRERKVIAVRAPQGDAATVIQVSTAQSDIHAFVLSDSDELQIDSYLIETTLLVFRFLTWLLHLSS